MPSVKLVKSRSAKKSRRNSKKSTFGTPLPAKKPKLKSKNSKAEAAHEKTSP